MTTIEVTIGWTKYVDDEGNLLSDGIPFFDPYVPGTPQHTETLTLDVDVPWAIPSETVILHIAEQAFAALNSPQPTNESELAWQIYLGVLETGYRGKGAHYSLSIGDTVTVGEVMLGCTRDGWQRVVAPVA